MGTINGKTNSGFFLLFFQIVQAKNRHLYNLLVVRCSLQDLVKALVIKQFPCSALLQRQARQEPPRAPRKLVKTSGSDHFAALGALGGLIS